MANIFLLEDEVELREELSAFFAAQGHQVIESGSIAEFRQQLADLPEGCDIALIDRGLPDGDGLDLVEALRTPQPGQQQVMDTGIIVFTARGASEDKIEGLVRGVDHYISKPTRLPELAAIVTALSRRLPAKASWELSLIAHQIRPPQGQPIPLTTLEFTFFKALGQASGRPVSRRELVTEFGEDYLLYDQNRLDTLVRRLRQKIEKDSGSELPVHTVRAVGFVFSAPLIILS